MVQADFTSWSIYTGPSNLKTIIDNPDCSWIVGTWDGLNANTSKEEIKKDIDYRISIVIDAFQKMLPQMTTYNRHFVIPEFFFRCVEGPYPNIKVDGQDYPFEYIVKTIKAKLQVIIPDDNNYYTVIIGSTLTSNIDDYETFLASDEVIERQNQLNAVLASGNLLAEFKSHNRRSWKRTFSAVKSSNDSLDALNDFMLMARANPLCTVRNRGAYFHFNKTMMTEVETYVYEKQYESTVDLTMGVFDENNKVVTGGMITEWLGNYPSYSILSGDKHTNAFSTNARFTPAFYGYTDIGVEICLDHRLQRLRRTVDMNVQNGAAADNYPLFKQFVPSGGMQILNYSVAATRNAMIFNSDGCDKIYKDYTDPNSYILNGDSGQFKGIACGVYNLAYQSKWTGRDSNTYYSHSQLAFTTNESVVGGFNNALGLNNPMATTYNGSEENPSNTATDSYQLNVSSEPVAENAFALNQSELHHYISG
ncbi:MAG: hypothetical protein MI810_18700 [Flavobacteriales bacterium]|nr:hypothetical protein [Flavobacteriales bacterium]